MQNCIVNPTPMPWKHWRKAVSLITLLNQVNLLAPGRSKVSDGMIGDEAHQSRDSDHNPWVWDPNWRIGVVTALDITYDPENKCDCALLAQAFQENKDKRIKYIIWNRQIMYSRPNDGMPAWTWQPYDGSNPHTRHIHISVRCEAKYYDSDKPWAIRIA